MFVLSTTCATNNMTTINAYLNFEGNCREVMNFYKECLGGELSLQTVGESALADQCPTAIHGQILHAMLTKDRLVIMGSDMQGKVSFTKGDNIALSLNCSSEEEIVAFYSNLSEGGHIYEKLGIMFWGAMFASFTDKYGIRWLLNYNEHAQ